MSGLSRNERYKVILDRNRSRVAVWLLIVISILLLGSSCSVMKTDNGPNSSSSQQGGEDQVTLSIPFARDDLPDVLIPMGETLEHPKPENPKGHPGIDFLWHDDQGGRLSKIYCSLDGTVTELFPSEGKWDLSVKSGKWRILYSHLKYVEPTVSRGTKIEAGDLLGESENMHWTFGRAQTFEDTYPDAMCPLKYFSSEDRELLESIPIMDKHKQAGFDEICSGDYKEE